MNLKQGEFIKKNQPALLAAHGLRGSAGFAAAAVAAALPCREGRVRQDLPSGPVGLLSRAQDPAASSLSGK